MKKMILITALLLSVFISTADARPGRHGEGAWPEQDWAMDHMMISDLDLTTEQTEKVQTLTESFHNDMAPLRYKKFQVQTELRLLWMQEKLTQEKIRTKQKELHDIKWQIMEKVTGYRFSFRQVLTPEQLSKFLVRRCNRPMPPNGERPSHRFHDDGKGWKMPLPPWHQ